MVAKALKIEHCTICLFNKFYPKVKFVPGRKIERFRCINDDNKRKDGAYRIIDKDVVMEGEIPGWCKLEDYPE